MLYLFIVCFWYVYVDALLVAGCFDEVVVWFVEVVDVDVDGVMDVDECLVDL